MSNIVTVTIGDATFYKTDPVFQYNDGAQILKIDGITLPPSYRVDFSNYIDSHEALSVLGDSSGAVIPSEILANGNTIWAFYVDVAVDATTTLYRIEIPVIKRPEPEDYEPSPEERGIIEQLVADVSELKGDLSTSASIDANGLITFKNADAQTTFTLQLPVYNGGVG